MTVSLILIGLIVGVGLILYVHHRLTSKGEPEGEAGDKDSVAEEDADGEGCCGMHITCERDSLVAGIDRELLYYDDEELDAYRGREGDEYTSEEIEMFRDVLLTLRPDEIAGWARSLTTRGIVLPVGVRDELLMIVAEARNQKSQLA